MSETKRWSEEYVMGIDEAGRGPVLSAMVYGACMCPKSKMEELALAGFNDSKALTACRRAQLFKEIKASDYLEWSVDVISADWMSARMQERNRYSLNEISHDSAIGLIQRALDTGMQLAHVILDTVGIPQHYERKLNNHFSGRNIKFTVESKADANFAVCGAASICAKETRDEVLVKHSFIERHLKKDGATDDVSESAVSQPLAEKKKKKKSAVRKTTASATLGNGYPSDEVTKKWLRQNVDYVFGFPAVVRFSWQTAKTIIADECCRVDFSDEKAENNLSRFGFGKAKKNARPVFFADRNIARVDSCPF